MSGDTSEDLSLDSGQFRIQRNLLLIASVASLLILAPDFKGLEINLAVIHLKVDNAVYVRGLIFSTLFYLMVRYSQAAWRAAQHTKFADEYFALLQAISLLFGVQLESLDRLNGTYHFHKSTKYLVLWTAPKKSTGRRANLKIAKVTGSYPHKTASSIGYGGASYIALIFVTANLMAFFIAPLIVVSSLEYLLPLELATLAMLELSGIHFFQWLMYGIGSLFPDASSATSLPQTETCLVATGTLDLLEAYRHALLGFEKVPAFIAVEGK